MIFKRETETRSPLLPTSLGIWSREIYRTFTSKQLIVLSLTFSCFSTPKFLDECVLLQNYNIFSSSDVSDEPSTNLRRPQKCDKTSLSFYQVGYEVNLTLFWLQNCSYAPIFLYLLCCHSNWGTGCHFLAVKERNLEDTLHDASLTKKGRVGEKQVSFQPLFSL